MLFSLALHPCLSDTQSRLDTGFITSYLDDAVLLGPCSSVVSAFQSFEKQLSNIGLVIRRDKCEAYSPKSSPSIWPLDDIPFSAAGTCLLGSPIGRDGFIVSECLRVITKEANFLAKLCGVHNLQSALLLLRYCCLPKINHLYRAVSPSFGRCSSSTRRYRSWMLPVNHWMSARPSSRASSSPENLPRRHRSHFCSGY